MAVAFSALSLGRVTTLAPDLGKAMDAATSVFSLLDAKPSIDPSDISGAELVIASETFLSFLQFFKLMWTGGSFEIFLCDYFLLKVAFSSSIVVEP